MSSNSRHIYIPSRKRQRRENRPERFHGAFEGGFSAGYFNTVGSKEGWQPRNEKAVEQKPEDFMDEQDHDDWGGPSSVRHEYSDRKSSKADPVELMIAKDMNVGKQLLRSLGWREGEHAAAYVPNLEQPGNADSSMEGQVLSSKKLRKSRKSQENPAKS